MLKAYSKHLAAYATTAVQVMSENSKQIVFMFNGANNNDNGGTVNVAIKKRKKPDRMDLTKRGEICKSEQKPPILTSTLHRRDLQSVKSHKVLLKSQKLKT